MHLPVRIKLLFLFLLLKELHTIIKLAHINISLRLFYVSCELLIQNNCLKIYNPVYNFFNGMVSYRHFNKHMQHMQEMNGRQTLHLCYTTAAGLDSDLLSQERTPQTRYPDITGPLTSLRSFQHKTHCCTRKQKEFTVLRQFFLQARLDYPALCAYQLYALPNQVWGRGGDFTYKNVTFLPWGHTLESNPHHNPTAYGRRRMGI